MVASTSTHQHYYTDAYGMLETSMRGGNSGGRNGRCGACSRLVGVRAGLLSAEHLQCGHMQCEHLQCEHLQCEHLQRRPRTS